MKKTKKTRGSTETCSTIQVDRIKAICLTLIWSLTSGPKHTNVLFRVLSHDLADYVISGAIANGLVATSGNKLRLTERGRTLAASNGV